MRFEELRKFSFSTKSVSTRKIKSRRIPPQKFSNGDTQKKKKRKNLLHSKYTYTYIYSAMSVTYKKKSYNIAQINKIIIFRLPKNISFPGSVQGAKRPHRSRH